MTEITINNITGLVPPYSGFACNAYGVYCEYLGEIIVTPVTLTLPATFNSAPSVGIKIIDSTGCESFKVIDCIDIPPEEKEFQDSELFYFMDNEIYQFQ